MSENKTRTSRISPDKNINKDYLYPTFDNNEILKEKKTGHLPAMGWNSWNAFGSNNTEVTDGCCTQVVSREVFY